jgi:hypothetical protein
VFNTTFNNNYVIAVILNDGGKQGKPQAIIENSEFEMSRLEII